MLGKAYIEAHKWYTILLLLAVGVVVLAPLGAYFLCCESGTPSTTIDPPENAANGVKLASKNVRIQYDKRQQQVVVEGILRVISDQAKPSGGRIKISCPRTGKEIDIELAQAEEDAVRGEWVLRFGDGADLRRGDTIEWTLLLTVSGKDVEFGPYSVVVD